VTPGPRAQFWQRLVGWIVDGLILWVVNRIIDATVGAAAGAVLGLVISLAFSVFFISSGSGQTPGMRLMGIRAIDATTGARIDPGKAIVRWLVSFASGIVFGLGYLWMLWDPEKQTWQDKAARTYVVPTADFPVEAWPG
jgi:uncharacterized RDD family membrane protein YckC